MALLKPSWNHADVLESLLLELLNQELEDAFMIVLDVKHILSSIVGLELLS